MQSKGLIGFLSKRSILRSFQLLISQNGVVNVEAFGEMANARFQSVDERVEKSGKSRARKFHRTKRGKEGY